MWVSHFKIDGSGCALGNAAKRSGVRMLVHPFSFFKEGNEIRTHFAAFIFGEPKKRKKCFELVNTHERIIACEGNHDFILAQILEKTDTAAIYNAKIIYTKPIEVEPNGTEHFALASFNKQALIDACKYLKSNWSGELRYINDVSINNFAMLTLIPKLSKNQHDAMKLALQEGYYASTRQVYLEQLAKLMGIQRSTFQKHLRLAEQKVLPHMFQRSAEATYVAQKNK